MRFHLSEEQSAIQDAVRGTLADAWPMERLHAFADDARDFDSESWAALMALGVGGLALPENAGGSGLGLLDAALVCEIAGSAAAAGPVIGQILTGLAVAHSDNAAAKVHLAGIASGETVATTIFSRGWLPDAWTNKMAKGSAPHVEAADRADLFLVGTAGAGLWLMEKGPAVSVVRQPSTDRTRPLSTVSWDAPATHQLFPAGHSFVARLFDAALILIAADALGGASHVTDVSVAYAKEREQFGQPIGRFQGLKHQLAHMALDVEPARALLWYGAYAWDADLPDAPRAAAMAKAHLADVYVRATRAAIAAHGGIGYTWEYGLNYWFRRAIFDRAYLGSPSEHRARAADMAEW